MRILNHKTLDFRGKTFFCKLPRKDRSMQLREELLLACVSMWKLKVSIMRVHLSNQSFKISLKFYTLNQYSVGRRLQFRILALDRNMLNKDLRNVSSVLCPIPDLGNHTFFLDSITVMEFGNMYCILACHAACLTL